MHSVADPAETQTKAQVAEDEAISNKITTICLLSHWRVAARKAGKGDGGLVESPLHCEAKQLKKRDIISLENLLYRYQVQPLDCPYASQTWNVLSTLNCCQKVATDRGQASLPARSNRRITLWHNLQLETQCSDSHLKRESLFFSFFKWDLLLDEIVSSADGLVSLASLYI